MSYSNHAINLEMQINKRQKKNYIAHKIIFNWQQSKMKNYLILVM